MAVRTCPGVVDTDEAVIDGHWGGDVIDAEWQKKGQKFLSDRERYKNRHQKRDIGTDTYKDMSGRERERESKDRGVIRCVLHPSRLHESLSREKQECSWKLWRSTLWNGYNILPLSPLLFLSCLSTPFNGSAQKVELALWMEREDTQSWHYPVYNALLNL